MAVVEQDTVEHQLDRLADQSGNRLTDDRLVVSLRRDTRVGDQAPHALLLAILAGWEWQIASDLTQVGGLAAGDTDPDKSQAFVLTVGYSWQMLAQSGQSAIIQARGLHDALQLIGGLVAEPSYQIWAS
jgi:hypothetical protein